MPRTTTGKTLRSHHLSSMCGRAGRSQEPFPVGRGQRSTPATPTHRAIRPSMLYRPGPEKISQTRIITYRTSGRYRKSSSQASTPLAWMLWIRLVATATIITTTSTSAHRGVNRPTTRPFSRQSSPSLHSTSDTRLRIWWTAPCSLSWHGEFAKCPDGGP